MQGVINVYKPEEFTSHDCVAIIRGASRTKKTGHTGTLDPMAKGILVVCIGKATRLIQYLDRDSKEYICTMTLGIRTDTQDIWGNVLERRDPSEIKPEKIREVLSSFVGVTEQKPPMFSAVKVKGKKLYEYARKGIDIEVKSRKVKIYSIEVIDIDGPSVRFRVICGSGTYVRTICDDAGKMLGCFACMTDLVRTRNGAFTLDDAVDIRDIKRMNSEELSRHVMPMDRALSFKKTIVDERSASDLMNGKKISGGEQLDNEERTSIYRIHTPEELNGFSEEGYSGEIFIGIAKKEGRFLIPEKIIYREETGK